MRELFRHLAPAGLVLALIAAGCGDSDDDTVTASTTTEAPDATTSAPPTTTSPPPTTTEADVVGVDELFDGEGPRSGLIEGFVVADAAGTLLCGTILESFPPQCGWPWVVVANPDGLDVELEQSGEVSWTDGLVRVDGRFDGSRLVLDDGSDVAPTPADLAVVETLTVFAQTAEGFEGLPFASEVGLGLADRILRTVTVEELTSAAAWALEDDGFRARTGPFSALELIADDAVVTVGTHAHCASPPVPAPEGFAGHRRISVQPVGIDSCLQWYTIDLFVNVEGTIDAVTLDLFEP